MNDVKFSIKIIMAHHNCPKMAGSSNPARPRMERIGTDYTTNNLYYSCPACGMEIMLNAKITEKEE